MSRDYMKALSLIWKYFLPICCLLFFAEVLLAAPGTRILFFPDSMVTRAVAEVMAVVIGIGSFLAIHRKR